MSKNKFSPAENFFIKRNSENINSPISDIKRRIYGLLNYELTNKNEKFKNSKRYINFYENIIKTTRNLSNILAHKAHSGSHWQNFELERLEWHLKHQMFGGRSMEIIFAEAMMRYFGEDFHFLPPKDMDLQSKIDFISRTKYRNPNSLKLETLPFGIQITLAKIDEERYNIKLEQMKKVAQNIDKTEIEKNFWRLATPEIITYIAINDQISEQIRKNDSFVLNKFTKWKRWNYEENGIIDLLKEEEKQELEYITTTLHESQKLFLNKNFVQNLDKNIEFEEIETENKNKFVKKIFYNKVEKILKVEIIKNGEKIAVLNFILTDENIEKLNKIAC